MFLNHSSFVEGEVLLFRTKKSRYRAIPVMKTSFESSSKFSDALTFKEFIRSWLQRVSGQEKGNGFGVSPFTRPQPPTFFHQAR